MPCLSCCLPPLSIFCPFYFLPLFGMLVLLPLSSFPSFYPACSTTTHTHFLSPFFMSCCKTHPLSFFLLYLSSHTYTHTPSFPFLFCLSYHTLTPSFLISTFFSFSIMW
jgi:hypothetical protein